MADVVARDGGQAPAALHHIIIRGIERKAIFKGRSDRSNFLKRFDRIISEPTWVVFVRRTPFTSMPANSISLRIELTRH